MRRRAASVAALGLLAAAAAPLSPAAPPSPATLRADIAARGPAAVIAALDASEKLDPVLDRMMTGAADWVALAPALAPGADGAAAEGLGIALAFALPKNPRAVLAVLDPADGVVLGASRVCGIPFIEDTVKDIPAYRRRALHAVGAVHDAALSRPRADCLAALRRP